jgi:hypothetical protein
MALRTIAALVLTLVLGSGTSDPPDPHRGQFSMTGLSADQVAVAEWARSLYDQAGLDLPDVALVGHSTTEPCQGRAGLHEVEDGRSVIHLCGRRTRALDEFLYLHELAHAWDRASLTDARRSHFLALRGLTEWRNDDPDRWGERGAEHAAEMIMWGLMDRPVRVVQIADAGCAQLLAGYVALTGRPPLHGYQDAC